MTKEEDELIWSCINPADNWQTPANSDGYNEGEVYGTAVRVLQAYKESEKYKTLELDAIKWRAFLKTMDNKKV